MSSSRNRPWSNFPSIDVAVMGEGETTMRELAMVSTADRKTAAT